MAFMMPLNLVPPIFPLLFRLHVVVQFQHAPIHAQPSTGPAARAPFEHPAEINAPAFAEILLVNPSNSLLKEEKREISNSK